MAPGGIFCLCLIVAVSGAQPIITHRKFRGLNGMLLALMNRYMRLSVVGPLRRVRFGWFPLLMGGGQRILDQLGDKRRRKQTPGEEEGLFDAWPMGEKH